MSLIGIVWRGKGWQIALATFLCSLIAEIITRYITNDEKFYESNPYPLSMSLLLSSLIAYRIYLRIKKINDARNLVEIFEAKGRNNPINSSNNKIHEIKDSLLFISVRYWPWILITLSISNILCKKLM